MLALLLVLESYSILQFLRQNFKKPKQSTFPKRAEEIITTVSHKTIQLDSLDCSKVKSHDPFRRFESFFLVLGLKLNEFIHGTN